VTFTKVLTIYKIDHAWVHPLHHCLLFLPTPIPGIVSTDIIFPFTYMYTQYLHYIHLHPPYSYWYQCPPRKDLFLYNLLFNACIRSYFRSFLICILFEICIWKTELISYFQYFYNFVHKSKIILKIILLHNWQNFISCSLNAIFLHQNALQVSINYIHKIQETYTTLHNTTYICIRLITIYSLLWLKYLCHLQNSCET
jgi:hypothetical protein